MNLDASKRLFNNLSSRAAEFYVPLYGGNAFPVDPVEMLVTTIEWSRSSTTCQLLAGDSGTGRSTEIERLVRTIDRYVMTLDIGEEVHPHTRVDFRTLLLAIHIAVEKAMGVASSPTLDLGCEIAANPNFRIPNIQISDVLKTLKKNLEYLKEQADCDEPPVLVFDNLNFEESGRLLDVFDAHAQNLRLPHFHTVYVVPKGIRGGGFDGKFETQPLKGNYTDILNRMIRQRGGDPEHILPSKWFPVVFRGDLNKAFKVLKAIIRLNRNNAGPASDAHIQMAIDEVGP